MSKRDSVVWQDEVVGDGVLAGVDEAGRGPLSGPVFAAAVILDPTHAIDGLWDSKKISERQRERLFDDIIHHSRAYGIASATVEEIDQLNILQASLLAMQRAVKQLKISPDQVWVDGNQAPSLDFPVRTVVKGDQSVKAICAASILAKVSRDRIMVDYDQRYPGYGFAQHKGYGTKKHLDALRVLGPCPIHRKTFAPVKHWIASSV